MWIKYKGDYIPTSNYQRFFIGRNDNGHVGLVCVYEANNYDFFKISETARKDSVEDLIDDIIGRGCTLLNLENIGYKVELY